MRQLGEAMQAFAAATDDAPRLLAVITEHAGVLLGAACRIDLAPSSRRAEPAHDRCLVLPLVAHADRPGVLLAARADDAPPFDATDRELATTLATQAALAITTAQLRVSAASELVIRDTLESRLRLLSELAEEFAAATVDFQSLIDLVVRRMAELVGDISSLRFVSSDNLWVEPSTSHHHVDPDVRALVGQAMADRVPVGQTLVGRVAQSGEPAIIPRMQPGQLAAVVHESQAAMIESLGVRSMMIVPIWARGRVIALATLGRRGDSRAYTHDDLRFLQDMVAHAGLAITNARLLVAGQRELAERNRLAARLRTLTELAQEFVAVTGDYTTLLDTVAKRVGQVLECGCSIRMLDDAGVLDGSGVLYDHDDKTLELLVRRRVEPQRAGEGISGRAIATGTTQFVRNMLTSSLYGELEPRYRALVDELGITSHISVPIRVHSEVIGACSVYRRGGTPFTDDDRRLVEDLVTHASLVIANSQLIEHNKREFLERMQTEQILRRSFLEAAPDPVVIVNAAGKILLVNTRTEHVFGYPRARLVGQPVEMLFPARFRDHDPALLFESPELFAQRADGTELAVEVSATKIETPEGTLVAAALRDVTERRRESEERSRRMQEASRLKSEFLANMSHELRTPLNAVIGFAALLHAGKAGPLDPTHREYIGDILTSARHLLQLINDVLDLSKVEAGRMDLRIEAVDLRRVVSEVRDIVRGLAADRRIKLAVEVDPALEQVQLDARLLKQVLYNYLSNAIKFTPEGGRVTLRIIATDAEHFTIEVEDTGIGIKPEDMDRLFREFEQIDQPTATRQQGTGLGLALTKRLVEAQHGRVDARSELGRGSVFTAVLPRDVQVPDGG